MQCRAEGKTTERRPRKAVGLTACLATELLIEDNRAASDRVAELLFFRKLLE
jgi:hypothetical protein